MSTWKFGLVWFRGLTPQQQPGSRPSAVYTKVIPLTLSIYSFRIMLRLRCVTQVPVEVPLRRVPAVVGAESERTGEERFVGVVVP